MRASTPALRRIAVTWLDPYAARQSVVVCCVFRLLRGTPDPYINPYIGAREHPFMIGTAFATVRNEWCDPRNDRTASRPFFSEAIAFKGE